MNLREIIRKVIKEKISLTNKQDNYYQLVAKAYDEAVDYDPSALKHWIALNKSNHAWFNRISSEVDLIFYSLGNVSEGSTINIDGKTFKLVHMDKDTYNTQVEMKNDYIDNKRLYISIDYSEHPYYTLEDNIVFRFVHDYLVHIKGGYSFGRGENLHVKLVPKEAVPALFTEIVGQASYAMVYGSFPKQKIVVLDEFDFYNVGYYKGKLVNENNSKQIDINKYNSFSKLTDEDLKDIAEWGLNNDFSFSGVFDETDDINEAIELVVESFKIFLNTEYPEGFKNIPNNLTLYRIISLNNIKDFDKNNLGYSWFSNPDRINDSYFKDQLEHLKGGKNYLLIGKTNENNINIPRTLFQRDSIYIENEIVLKNDKNIKLVNIKKIE